MELGVIGLGRMGQIIVDRVLAENNKVVTFDVDKKAIGATEEMGAIPSTSISNLVEKLGKKKKVWLMVPSGDPVDSALEELSPLLDSDDIIIDGGNSNFQDSIRRSNSVESAYLDCGTSGGPAGAEIGFSLMVGGPKWAYKEMKPIFDAIATGPEGHNHFGPSGAGHYVKMVHNGIEYALMQSYGEGFELLANGRYDIDLGDVAETWNNGAVVRSWLLELSREAFREEGNDLGDVADYIEGGSTGTWTVQEALKQEIPVPIIYTALAERFNSRKERLSRKLANRLRYGFGRHKIKRKDEK